MDLCEEVIGGWRGESGDGGGDDAGLGRAADRGGAIATAELAGLRVDQCALVEDRFTLLAPDAYREDYLEIVLFGRRGERAGARVALRGRRRGRRRRDARCRCRCRSA